VARVLVAGASGYTGALAAQLVWNHPRLELVRITARADAGTPLKEIYTAYDVPLELEEPGERPGDGVDAAIVGYPHGAAAPVVAALREEGVRVVDLSADFRLRNLDTYAHWYGDHPAPELVSTAVYGLTELNREAIARADLVANPGCYPTATVLALAPLAEAGLIEDVVVDAKSGVSGAGRAAAEEMQGITEGDDALAYKVGGHRHSPEISQELTGLGNAVNGDGPMSLTFVPHLLPFHQGELVSCYVRSSEPVESGRLQELYEQRYADEPFIELVDSPPGVGAVRGTNLCRIHVTVGPDSGRILAFGAIDNLWKGASGQAVQNLNLMLGLDEGEGL
jgi:N-acetyl-gamma-glutamyl-phosphate reductase